MTLEQAQTTIAEALKHARANNLAPLAVAVLDARSALKAFAAEEDTPIGWSEIAIGKARGALTMGVDSRKLGEQALERPHFIAAVTHAVGGTLVPVAGGVLIRINGKIAGAVGIAGDTSDNDEAAAKAGIAASEWS